MQVMFCVVFVFHGYELSIHAGNLHFANVVSEDARGDNIYMCVVMNGELRSLAQGDDQKIQPIRYLGKFNEFILPYFMEDTICVFI